MENIMKDSPKNEFDEDDSTDIYFTKSSKIDLQSTDCSSKIFSLTDKDEICKDFFRTVLHKKRGRKKEKEEKEKKKNEQKEQENKLPNKRSKKLQKNGAKSKKKQ
jgi:hypothetical protein